MDGDALAPMLRLAIEAAEAPRATILAHYRQEHLPTDIKADGSPVTIADRKAEQEIRGLLRSAPESRGFAILGEEFGLDEGDARYCWLIDPIDGTSAFARGLPTYGTIIALIDRETDRPLAGAIHLPSTAETYAAARGLGAFCNGQPIRASDRHDLTAAILSLPDPYQFRSAGLEDGYFKLYPEVEHICGLSSCFAHAMAARGSVDAILEPWLNPWDIKATEVIVEEAGGTCLLRKSKRQPEDGRLSLDGLFGSPRLVEQIARIVDF